MQNIHYFLKFGSCLFHPYISILEVVKIFVLKILGHFYVNDDLNIKTFSFFIISVVFFPHLYPLKCNHRESEKKMN